MASSFSFDFSVRADNGEGDTAAARDTDKEDPNKTESLSSQLEVECDSSSRTPFVWLSPAEVGSASQERALQEMVYTEIPVGSFPTTEDEASSAGKKPLCCVDLEVSSFTPRGHHSSTGTTTDENVGADCWKKTDLAPKVYEGGMKVWECSVDLVHHLAAKEQQNDLRNVKNVLELGCGHGLPTCFLLRELVVRQIVNGAINGSGDTRSDDSTKFFLTDFNDFVIRDATLSNLVLNVADAKRHGEAQRRGQDSENTDDEQTKKQHAEDVSSLLQKHVRLGYGDWMTMSQQLQQQLATETSPKASTPTTFDLILAAETVYSGQAAKETALILLRHLQPRTGVGLVATKRYYFGAGGGSDAFREAALSTGELQVETVRVYDNGSSNIRELLQVRRATNG